MIGSAVPPQTQQVLEPLSPHRPYILTRLTPTRWASSVIENSSRTDPGRDVQTQGDAALLIS